MPNRAAHNTGIAALASITLFTPLTPEYKLLVAAGMLVGTSITPDLDLSKKGYWKLYGKVMSHRGISHVPVVGTVTRLIYIGVFPCILMYLSDLWHYVFSKQVLLLIIGLVMADILHISMDIIWTKIRNL